MGSMANDKPHEVRIEGRREERLALALPVRVLGYDAEGNSWQELTETADLSSNGLSLIVHRPVFRGQVLRLALPMPKTLRTFDAEEPAYRVYAIVRSAVVKEGACRVGAMFYGKQPPRGYTENPGARFLLPSDMTPDPARPAEAAPPVRPEEEANPDPYGRRGTPRFDIFVDFMMELVDEWGAVLQEERTVAENISKGGARLRTARKLTEGDVIVLKEVNGGFEARAQVRGFKVGPDGIRRLHVMFLDGKTPDHLVRTR
jgi:hypothetical protein